MQSSMAPPWKRFIARIPEAMQAFSGAPVEAALRAARHEGGVTPWSIELTSMESTILPTLSSGSRPVSSMYTTPPKLLLPISSSSGRPRGATRFGAMSVIDVYHFSIIEIPFCRLLLRQPFGSGRRQAVVRYGSDPPAVFQPG